jgi:TPR repeat protein
LEFSRFAFRATNFALGYCLAQRSAGLGESRAHILLGIAEMMGWGTAKSGEAAFHSFDTAANAGDVWGTYFLSRCYEEGIGTPRDLNKVAQINTWLDLRPAGQALFYSIGADDLGVWRAFERAMVYVNPPVTQRSVCSVAASGKNEVCHTEEHVDEDGFDRQLQQIDSKYK